MREMLGDENYLREYLAKLDTTGGNISKTDISMNASRTTEPVVTSLPNVKAVMDSE